MENYKSPDLSGCFYCSSEPISEPDLSIAYVIIFVTMLAPLVFVLGEFNEGDKFYYVRKIFGGFGGDAVVQVEHSSREELQNKGWKGVEDFEN